MTLEINEPAGQRDNTELAMVGSFGLFLTLVLPQCCPRRLTIVAVTCRD
jgi:hypothetical protein